MAKGDGMFHLAEKVTKKSITDTYTASEIRQ